MSKPILVLTRQDGNVFHVLGLALKAGKAAGWTKKRELKTNVGKSSRVGGLNGKNSL